MSRWR